MGATSKTRTKIQKGAGSIHRQALPDDPIFTRGFVFGGLRTKASFPSRKPSSSEESKPKAEKEADDAG